MKNKASYTLAIIAGGVFGFSITAPLNYVLYFWICAGFTMLILFFFMWYLDIMFNTHFLRTTFNKKEVGNNG